MYNLERCETGQVARPSVMERLVTEKKMLTERLSKVDSALKALEENPQIAEVLETVSKVIN